jgi:putative PIN family toxin of toxin-antitoxin system
VRIVVDTNVVVSRFLSPNGSPAKVLQAWQDGGVELLVSSEILVEYRRALGYTKVQARHGLSDDELDQVIEGFRQQAFLIEPNAKFTLISADPDDDKFMECAIAGGAACVVSGDAHLLGLGEYAGIVVLSPAAFLALLENSVPR